METSEISSAKWLPAGTFQDQVAVVTGGGTGLGLQISRGLAELGAKVVITSRDPEHHTARLREAKERDWTVRSLQCDVREPQQIRGVVEAVTEEFGHVDILVNNAAGNFVCPAERLSSNAWRSVLGIVLDGTFYCSKAFGKSMLARGSGQIFNVVATYAWTGMPGVVHSASAKAGVLAMTKTLASEWASRGVRVNAIAPGPFESSGARGNLWPTEEIKKQLEQQIPLKRFADVDAVAAHCLYMLSPASEYITGECLVVDGGATLAPSMWADGARPKRKREPQ